MPTCPMPSQTPQSATRSHTTVATLLQRGVQDASFAKKPDRPVVVVMVVVVIINTPQVLIAGTKEEENKKKRGRDGASHEAV